MIAGMTVRDHRISRLLKEHIRHGRRAPYTEIGVRRIPCYRCGAKARYQWQVCADDRLYRPLCTRCDIELNRLVLEWMGAPEADEKMRRYAEAKQ